MPFGIKRAIRRSVDMLFFFSFSFFPFDTFSHISLIAPIALNFSIFSYLYKLLVISYIKIQSGHTGYLPHCEEEQAVTRAPLAIATRITRIFVLGFFFFFS